MATFKNKFNLFKNKIVNKCSTFFSKIKNLFSKLVNKVKNSKVIVPKLQYMFELSIIVLIYGLMLNLIYSQFFNGEITLLKTISFGLVFYLIKYEATIIIQSCLPEAKK